MTRLPLCDSAQSPWRFHLLRHCRPLDRDAIAAAHECGMRLIGEVASSHKEVRLVGLANWICSR
jgi:hypothetical protein